MPIIYIYSELSITFLVHQVYIDKFNQAGVDSSSINEN